MGSEMCIRDSTHTHTHTHTLTHTKRDRERQEGKGLAVAVSAGVMAACVSCFAMEPVLPSYVRSVTAFSCVREPVLFSVGRMLAYSVYRRADTTQCTKGCCVTKPVLPSIRWVTACLAVLYNQYYPVCVTVYLAVFQSQYRQV